MTDPDPATLPLPPGSMGLPFIGQSLELLRDNRGFFLSRYQKYGPVFKTSFGGNKVICFVGHEALTFFYNPERIVRAGANPSPIKDLFNYTAIPLVDGEEHRTRKALYLSTVTAEQMAKLLPLLQNCAERHIGRWERMRTFAWRTENEFLCQGAANALVLGDETGSADPTTKAWLDTYIKGLTALPINLFFTAYHKALKARDNMLAMVGRSVDFHRNRLREGRPIKDMLTSVIQANMDAGTPLSDDTLRTDGLHIYFSVYIGLALQLTFVQMSLAQNRDAMARARREVLDNSPAGAVTREQLDAMPFVRWVAKEARRLNPVLPLTFLARIPTTTSYLGYQLPAGWLAIASVYATMRDPAVFIAPEKFQPERFAPDSPMPLPINSYVPHGGGEQLWHRCLGEEPANFFLELIIVLLLRCYDWELVPGQDLSMESGQLFSAPKSGLQVVFKRYD
ncbi:MAG TPA: cytochrome P450 [Thermoanaerobaculia bacterium]|nr:cytochrome P450 [Thermoanaerobaculia bacterium]